MPPPGFGWCCFISCHVNSNNKIRLLSRLVLLYKALFKILCIHFKTVLLWCDVAQCMTLKTRAVVLNDKTTTASRNLQCTGSCKVSPRYYGLETDTRNVN